MSVPFAGKADLKAVPHARVRGWWYYIDGDDVNTKWFFQIFEALLSARLADTAEGARVAPVLTVPVSR